MVRGEYKVPGGKLVAVDLEIADRRLADVHLSGDFFLEPDSALEDICRALTGMPADATATQVADAIRARLAPGVQMVGFSAQAIGIAVRRAVGSATGWADHTFDLIGPAVLDPVLHVALDEVLPSDWIDSAG